MIVLSSSFMYLLKKDAGLMMFRHSPATSLRAPDVPCQRVRIRVPTARVSIEPLDVQSICLVNNNDFRGDLVTGWVSFRRRSAKHRSRSW